MPHRSSDDWFRTRLWNLGIGGRVLDLVIGIAAGLAASCGLIG